MNTFWRVTPQSNAERDLQGRSQFQRESDFINRLRVGHGIVMADWAEGTLTGEIKALGIVVSVDKLNESAEVEWRKVEEELRPNPQGGVPQWRKPKGWFAFAKNVVDQYELPSLFHKAFPDQ